ncbi:MAG: hypothetical protein JSS20_15215 [Proteobacteria bacterium]|nr:hypothetical protein [Pseudomonadota bacterium]
MEELRKPRLTVRAVAILFVIATAFAGWITFKQRLNYVALARYGATTVGKIEELEVTRKNPHTTVSFASNGLQHVAHWDFVDEGSSLGSAINVLYLPDDPSINAPSLDFALDRRNRSLFLSSVMAAVSSALIVAATRMR